MSVEHGASRAEGRLIESDDASPTITVSAGMRFEVRSTTVVDGDLKQAKKIAGRLCGGTSTCIALFEI